MGNKGQSLVEFGISLVILIFLLSGLVEFGVIFFQFIQLRDAAQEGALYGATCDCPVLDIQERALNSSDTPLDLKVNTSVFVSVTTKDKLGNPVNPDVVCEGGSVTVVVSYAHRIFMPFLPQMLGVDYINLNGSATDTVLRPICP